MGLFDQVCAVPATEQPKLNGAEAFAAIALTAIAADGYLSDEEAQSLPYVLSRMNLFQGYANAQMERLFDKLLTIMKNQGIAVLLAAAQTALPEKLEQTAFAVATDLILSDGCVTPEEQTFLDELHRVLKISEATAQNIIDVMLIKNQG
ncbi:MAG: tellurite resistance TerB family protein [Prochlorothrix sp.]|nr:tellurite resistance TerB family protein [Prochlorothrix sp.]